MQLPRLPGGVQLPRLPIMASLVGTVVQYNSKNQGRWIKTDVIDQRTTPDGTCEVQLTCKKGAWFATTDPCVRIATTSDAGDAPAAASMTSHSGDGDSSSAATAERERGAHDDSAVTLATELLGNFGGLQALFIHLHDTWNSTARHAEVKAILLAAFSKGPVAGICYAKVSVPPSSPITRGHVHPTMLSFAPCAWDLWMPYEQDFLRELQSVWDHGWTNLLHITPYAMASPAAMMEPLIQSVDEASERWSAFAWGPDGSYKDFVNVAVLVFVSLQTAAGLLRPPHWLAQDMSGMGAICEQKGSPFERAVSGLRVSTKDALTVRSPDPLMLDWMLANVGLSSDPAKFVKKYNTSVFYDKSLMLEDHAATRQSNLLNPDKISAHLIYLCAVKSVHRQSCHSIRGLLTNPIATE